MVTKRERERYLRPDFPNGEISISPFNWRPPESIPKRKWILGRHVAQRFVGATVAAGGTGKTALVLAEALSLASGKDFLKLGNLVRNRAWYIGLEDPLVEYERRVAACARLHKLTQKDLDDAFFLNGGRSHPFIIAQRWGDEVEINDPVVDAMIDTIKTRGIGYVVVDPFVACHHAQESDNTRIGEVVRAWTAIAERTGAAIELVHHTRKRIGAEADGADARGASALIDGVRSARVLLPMSEDEADRAELDGDRRRYFRVATAKANLAVADGEGQWREIVSVPLGNGEEVGAVAAWSLPGLASDEQLAEIRSALQGGKFRLDVRAKDWAGMPVARILGLDPAKPANRRRLRRALRGWIDDGVLAIHERKDEERRPRPYVVVP
jgi:hypothetical protein